MGTPTRHELASLKNCPHALAYQLQQVFSTSCSFLPKYDGVIIQIFGRVDELPMKDDVKAMILFSSGVAFNGDYLELTNVAELFSKMEGRVAVGGGQINDKLTTYLVNERFSDDTANFYFRNGAPPYNPMYNPQKLSLIGLMFRGPNVTAASVSVRGLSFEEEQISKMANEGISVDLEDFTRRELDLINAQLSDFKAKLTFDPDDTSSKTETIAFIFFSYTKYSLYSNSLTTQQASPGLDEVRKIFPCVTLTGVLSHAQYEHNYWSGLERVDHSTPPALPSNKPIMSMVLIHINK